MGTISLGLYLSACITGNCIGRMFWESVSVGVYRCLGVSGILLVEAVSVVTMLWVCIFGSYRWVCIGGDCSKENALLGLVSRAEVVGYVC